MELKTHPSNPLVFSSTPLRSTNLGSSYSHPLDRVSLNRISTTPYACPTRPSFRARIISSIRYISINLFISNTGSFISLSLHIPTSPSMIGSNCSLISSVVSGAIVISIKLSISSPNASLLVFFILISIYTAGEKFFPHPHIVPIPHLDRNILFMVLATSIMLLGLMKLASSPYIFSNHFFSLP